MPCEPPRCAACSARSEGLCGTFSGGEITALFAIARQRRAPAGQVLLWAGEPASFCATLVTGVLKIARQDAEGREQIVGLLFPGDFVGEPFAGACVDSVVALSDANLCVYPRAPLEHLLEAHPPAARLLLRRALSTLTAARRWILTLGRRNARQKVASFLLEMATRSTQGDRLELPLSRGAMGEALGLTIETVSRQMTALVRAQVIELAGHRGILLLNRAQLTTLATL